ncbi:hypothetical protein [Phyllobacterium sp. P5_D12]
MALTIMIFFERGERDFGRLAGMAVKRELFLLSPTLSIHTSRIEHEVHTHIAQTARNRNGFDKKLDSKLECPNCDTIYLKCARPPHPVSVASPADGPEAPDRSGQLILRKLDRDGDGVSCE